MSCILLVDDTRMERELMAGLLQDGIPHPIEQAENGEQALEIMRNQPVEIVVTDLNMPNLDGLELIKIAKREFPLIPIVLATSYGSEEIAVEALQTGAASYIPKRRLNPLLKETVLGLLRTLEEEKIEARVLMRMTEYRSVFVLENDLPTIIALVKYFREGMRGLQLCDRMDRIRVCTALEEALLNAFYHGNLELSSKLKESGDQTFQQLAAQRCGESPYRDRRIHVEAELDGAAVRFTVRDEGAGFDVASIPDPRDPEHLKSMSGRGLLLMNSFMDQVAFNQTGNEVTLHRKH
ncbi:MAG: response regulator [Planctomycetota bacterium]|nr:response regulator [Planctomycetota bacterium]